MAQSGGDQSWLSAWPGGILIAILVALGIVVQSPFKAARPPEDKSGSASGAHIADARLWQDPFAAASAAKKVKLEAERDRRRQDIEKQGAKFLDCLAGTPMENSDLQSSLAACARSPASAGTPGPQKSPEASGVAPKAGEGAAATGWQENDALEGLRKEIESRAKGKSRAEGKSSGEDKENVLVLGIMVSAGPTSGAAERRRRSRYAALVGLMAERFYPDDAEHVSYVSLHKDGLPSLMPYEWLKKESGPEYVLILWLDDDALAKHGATQGGAAAEPAPLAHLSELFTALNPSGSFVRFAAIGPAHSGTLVAMADECRRQRRSEPLPDDASAQVWSPMATIPKEQAKFKEQAECQACSLVAAPPGQNGRRVALLPPTGDYRTIATDDDLARTLIDELGKRQVKGDAHIALVGQWDTGYSRSLAQLIRDRWHERKNLPPSQDGKYNPPNTGDGQSQGESDKSVHYYNYLRGIDGQILGAKLKDGVESDAKAESKDIERAEGDAQTDYLRRMRDALMADDWRLRQECGLWARVRQECGIRAIGVLGNDYFDKLLVLQALKPVFPNAVFFTTDLHADMLHPQHNVFTRNLVVASGFGLTLPGNQQKGIPPLRDSYQTALLDTVRQVLQAWLVVESATRKQPKPRLFEIGRTEAVELPTESHSDPLPHYYFFADTKQGWASAAVFLAVLCLALLAVPGFRRWMDAAGPWLKKSLANLYGPAKDSSQDLTPATPKGDNDQSQEQTGKFWRQLFDAIKKVVAIVRSSGAFSWRDTLVSWASARNVAIAVTVIAATLLGLLSYDLSEGGEPFSLVQGVSAWPTELLRLVAGIGAVFFLIRGHRKQLDACRMIEETLHLGKSSDPDSNAENGHTPHCAEFLNGNDAGGETNTKAPLPPCAQFLTRENDKREVRRAEDIWKDYRESIGSSSIWKRIRMEVLVFLLLAVALMVAFGFPNKPIRGGSAWWLDNGFILFCVIPFVVLLFYAVDATRQALTNLAIPLSGPVSWPRATLCGLGLGAWTDTKDPSRGTDVVWLDVKLIGKVTEPVGNLVRYPMLVLILIALARLPVFDAWALAPALVLVLVLSGLYIVGSAYALRQGAEKVRKDAHDELTTALAKAEDDAANTHCAERLRNLLAKVDSAQEGAFRPFTQQPAVQSVLALISSVSGFALLEFLSRANL